MSTTNKWRQTGMLDGLNEDQCDELASSLEVMTNRLFEDVPPYTEESERFAGMILPIVCRLYDEIKPLPNIHWIYNDFKRFYNENKTLRDELCKSAINKIDSDTEFSILYLVDVVNRLNNS